MTATTQLDSCSADLFVSFAFAVNKDLSKTTANMTTLPVEVIQAVYHNCPDVKTLLNLSQTSSQFYNALEGSQKLPILFSVVSEQCDPIEDAIQLVTYNKSQPAWQERNISVSLALIKQLVQVGNVANKWVEVWPLLRWRKDTSYRRVLLPHEQTRLRRAIYRYWLYSKAYHSPAFLSLNRDYPVAGDDDKRLTFMRQFSVTEIIELQEVQSIFENTVHNDICPTNAMLHKRYLECAPGHDPLYFDSYETYGAHSYDYRKLRYNISTREMPFNIACEAWGNYKRQAEVVQDIMKLSPAQLWKLRELPNKAKRQDYLGSLTQEFHENPSTFRDTVEAVMAERDYMIGTAVWVDGGIVDELDDEEESMKKAI